MLVACPLTPHCCNKHYSTTECVVVTAVCAACGVIQGNNYVTAVDTPQNYAYIWREEKVQDHSLNTNLSVQKPATCFGIIQHYTAQPSSAEHRPYNCTAMPRLTTGIRYEKRVVRRFRLCANVIECTYTNLDSTV
jgi:hypothetical protein